MTHNHQVAGSIPAESTRKREYDNNYNEVDNCAQVINGDYFYVFIQIFVISKIMIDNTGCINKTDNNKSSLG